MSDFLAGERLGRAIKELMQGGEIRCAVAFWGDGAARALLPEGYAGEGARIVCDVSMGGTNPEELKALGAPNSKRLRHLAGLHAKVYWSDRGAIVGSANASNNGIGLSNSPTGLIEAGSFLAPGSPAHLAAKKWFDDIWSRAAMVDAAVLERAREAWGRQQRKRSEFLGLDAPPDPKSLLETVAAKPQQFRGFGVVFTKSSATCKDLEDTVGALKKGEDLTPKQKKGLPRWAVENLFSNWTREEIGAWPRQFVCAHQGGRGGVSYQFYERVHDIMLADQRGMVLGRRDGNLRRTLGFSCGAMAMVRADKVRLEKIFEHIGERGALYESGDKLRELLIEVG